MISGEHPFLPSDADRDPTRRFRGRLVAPVTIVTSGTGSNRTGLTVSSLVVLEGDPGVIQMVVGPLTDLWDRLEDTGRCVVHVAQERHQAAADVFAGQRPSPGGLFADIEALESEWGPVLTDLVDRAYCRVGEMEESGWSGIVTLELDRVDVSDLTDPLIHFRGRYRHLG